MPVQHFNGLGSIGILTDSFPSDLPAQAWSDGRNISFRRGKVIRAPVFKLSASLVSSASPVALVTFGDSSGSGLDIPYVFFSNGAIRSIQSDGSTTDVDQSGITYSESLQKQTTCILADVLYVNRADLGIRRLRATDTSFEVLENTGMPAWTCQVLRAYQDFLIALNVTKGEDVTTTMVKWSNAALAGQVPSDWDQTQNTDISTLAGENILAEMDGPILDGMPLKSDFLIYGRSSVWAMTFTGNGTYPFEFRSLFNSGGILGANCVVEVQGLHYVFGQTNLYMHDGISMVPLLGVSDRVFQEKASGAYDPAYVVHDALHQCVLFCYQTGEALGSYCNRAAVYNYVDKTWTFVDMPNSAGSYYGSVVQYPNWLDGPGRIWDDDQASGATWEDDVVYKEALMVPSASLSLGGTSYITVYDDVQSGVFSGAPVEALNPSAWVQREGINLGTTSDTQMDLTQVKRFRTVIPRFAIGDATAPSTVSVTFGGSYEFTGDTAWGPEMSWQPATRHRIDSRVTGRLVAMKFEVQELTAFTFSAMDVEYVTAGRR